MTDSQPDAAGAIAPRKAAARRLFSFGDPEPVLSRRTLFDMLECVRAGRWYEPPIPPRHLARAYRIAPHHSSAIVVKRNMLLKTFVPSALLSASTFGRWVLDYLVLGNGYLERRDNLAGRPLTMAPVLGVYTRVGVEAGHYWFVTDARAPHEFRPDSVFHLAEPDLTQEIYGAPDYLSALQSSLLNEAATLFRRRYYDNGSHAGYILYATDAGLDDEDAEDLETALAGTKGLGNFRNLFLHVPGGKKDGLQLIPIGEAAAKDEFLGIKNTTRDDMLAAHRVPPQLLGVVPANAGGFGDVEKAAAVFFRNEIEPLQTRLLELNDWLGAEAVRFAPYDLLAPAPKAA
ncbi:MAG TPA: phage portal protein [Sphingomonadaceae bacterium]|nr:phage portal protein [Sphingomonadaceae bacterium]